MTHKTLEQHSKWRDALIYHLRLKNVSGDKIGDVLLEVESHLEETGETPEQAFGEAKTYAESRIVIAPDDDDEEEESKTLLIALIAFAGSALYASGAIAIGAGEADALFGINSWIVFVLGAAILLIGLSRLPMDLIRHPETGSPMLGDTKNLQAFIFIVIIALGVALYFVGRALAG